MIQVGDRSSPTEGEEDPASRYLSATGAGAARAGFAAGMKVVVVGDGASRECDAEGRDVVGDLNELTRL